MNSNKYRGWIAFLYLLVAFLFGMSVAINFLPSRKMSVKNVHLQKLNEVMNYIDHYYVDEVDVDSIYDVAINSILQSLDPHSAYATREENQAMMESLGGSFEGVGIQFNIMNDTLMVVSTVSGGPSEKAGLKAGDRVVSVDGKSIIGITSEKAFKLLRGTKGTKVKVGVVRPGFSEVYHYTIKRDVIPTYTVDVAYMVDKTIGYIKINEFGTTTTDEFITAIKKLKNRGMKSMIVDLRGNSGGFLDAAVGVCDELLSNREMIVSVEGLRQRSEKISATRKGNFETGKVVILIDDFSASASEVVAGAVQDNDRGYIVGRRSFGKGLVQRQFDLSDKSTIRLTTARYYTPSGRCIQRDYGDGKEAYYNEILDRYMSGEMANPDSVKLDSTKAFKTIKGRTVYGGGGIMPDYFVPIDHDDQLDGYYQVANTAALIQYAFDYTNNHKSELQKQYANPSLYVSKMVVSDAQLSKMLEYYKKIKKNNETPVLSVESKKELKIWIKALIGRNLYGDEAFYPVINASDPVMLKACAVLHQK